MSSSNTKRELTARGERSAKLAVKLRNLGPGFGRLWHNGRNDSLPFIVYAAAFALTQWHRHTLTPSQYVSEVYGLYGWIVIPAVLIFFIALVKASKAFILGVTAGLAAIGSWMAYATVSGVTLKSSIIGLILTCVMGIPYWLRRATHEVEMTKARTVAQVKGADVKSVGTFDHVPWLKGGEWLSDPIATDFGTERVLLLPDRMAVTDFVDSYAERMANVVRAPDATSVELVAIDGSRVKVITYKSNILVHARQWPLKDEARTDILAPIPVGLYRDRKTAGLSLKERHLLIGGVPGSGKSGLAQMLVAVGALDPRCDLWLFDGKKVELRPWRDAATVYVGDKNAEAVQALRQLQAEMTRRLDIMAEMEVRKFDETGGRVNPLLLVIDELARYLRDGTTAEINDFRSRLGDVLDRGRACGVMVVALTQQPTADMLKELRRSFTYRIALRVVEREHSKMILGTSFPDASLLDENLPGLAYLGTERKLARQMRAFYLTDAEIKTLVSRAYGPTEKVDIEDVIVIDDMPELEASPEPKVTTMFVANEDNDAATFPDGSRVPAHRKGLWEALSASPRSANELASLVGLTQNPVRETLRRWVAEGYIEREPGKAPVGDRYFKE